MKKLTSKIILLSMIIPLILIFVMGTTIDITSFIVDVPVTNVEILGEKVIFIDVCDDNNTVKINTVISPNQASNKSVSYSTQKISGQKEADVEISKEGVVSPKSTGSVRVVATASGGRQDSVQITFYSSFVSDIEQLKNNYNIAVGEEVNLSAGIDFELFPNGANGSVTYYSESERVKVDRYSGKVTGLFMGQAKVIAIVEGIKYDNESKKFINSTHEIEFLFEVSSNSQSNPIFSFSKGETEKEEIVFLDEVSVPFEYNNINNLGDLTYEINSEDSEYIESVEFESFSNNIGNVKVIFKDNALEKYYIFNIMLKGVNVGVLVLKKQTPNIMLSSSRKVFNISNANIIFGSEVIGLDNGYVIKCESSNPQVFSVNTRNNDCVGIAKSEGSSLVRVKLYINGELVSVSEEVEFSVVDSYISIAIVEGAKTYGLENRFVFAKYNYKGHTSVARYKLDLKLNDYKGSVENVDYNKLKWSVSDASIANVDNNGEIFVLNDGVVTVTVESKYNEVLGSNLKSSFEIECKKQAINVYGYQDLLWANQNNYEIVLMDNVKLADGINSNNYKEYLNSQTTVMKTTADYSYYRDNDKIQDATVRYCFEFLTNVYGNGFSIDGDNITQSAKKYNYSVFNGPLDLLSLSYGNNSSSNAKLKAQDNIVFVVIKDGININNVELKGCSDESLVDIGMADLSKLNNVGTVLEVVGDGFNLNYSRVNNGRTVIRIYGAPNQEDSNKLQENIEEYKIVANISNCILSYGREFIMKVGTNQIKRNPSVIGEELSLPSEDITKYEHAAPSLTNAQGEAYKTTEEKDEYFIDKYLLTDINLKDSIFYGAGLFCIGFESQLAGLALHGYDYGNYKFSKMGWKAIAGTSYPARINMYGDVRFYDWKEVSRIDSDTLVEGDRNLLETIGLDFNVSNLLNKYDKEHPTNKCIYTYQGNDYINGAIVFYGGGKNYSWVDTSNVNLNFNQLEEFSVPVSYFGNRVNLIYIAAGKEDFRFMSYSSEGNINYVSQQKDLLDGNAYIWLTRSDQKGE